MYITCIHIDLQCTSHVYISIYNVYYMYTYRSTMYITCIHIHLQCTLHVYISIYNVHYMYTYPSTMYITCIHIHLQCTLHVYISIYNVHYMYTYSFTMYITCVHTYIYTNCFSDSSAAITAVKFYSHFLTSSSLLSFSSSSVTKPGNNRTHT